MKPKLSAMLGMLLVALGTNSALAVGFADQGFMQGAVRTEYPQGMGAGGSWLNLWYTNNGLPGKEGCLWNSDDPNNIWGCPGRVPIPGGSPYSWLGNIQTRDACGDPSSPRIGDSWLSCISYQQSNLFSVNWQPGQNYWVVVANSDPAFDQCNLGPPNLSWPVVDPINQPYTTGYFKVASEQYPGKKRAHIIINADDHTHKCKNNFNAGWFYTIPFLSIGAQQGRGQQDVVAYISNSTSYASRDKITFDLAVLSYSPFTCRAGSESICNARTGYGGVHAGIYLMAEWADKKRLVFVDLLGEGVQTISDTPIVRHWPWPVADSFLYPGHDMIAFNTTSLKNSCGISL